jgi:hypothetical protein
MTGVKSGHLVFLFLSIIKHPQWEAKVIKASNMSETNAIAILNELQSSVPALNDETFNSLVGAQNNYSSRLQLFSFNSGAVKDKKIEEGHFAIVNGQELTDLGEEVCVMPVGIRCKAMDLSGDKPSIAYNQEGSLFQDIQTRSKVKDSNCMVGVEFLVYVADKDVFTTFYLANATLLREAGNLKSNLGLPVKLKSRLIKKERYSWHGITVTAFPADIQMPPKDRFQSEIQMFSNAQDSTPDAAE